MTYIIWRFRISYDIGRISRDRFGPRPCSGIGRWRGSRRSASWVVNTNAARRMPVRIAITDIASVNEPVKSRITPKMSGPAAEIVKPPHSIRALIAPTSAGLSATSSGIIITEGNSSPLPAPKSAAQAQPPAGASSTPRMPASCRTAPPISQERREPRRSPLSATRMLTGIVTPLMTVSRSPALVRLHPRAV